MNKNLYCGELTVEDASIAIIAIRKNAKKLLSESKLLFENKFYERAFSLAILAVEENSKVQIIKGILLKEEIQDLKKLWKDFRTHSQKNWPLLFLSLPLEKVTSLEEIGIFLQEEGTISKNLELLKQQSIYTDFQKGIKIVSPEEVIDKVLAERTIKKADQLLDESLFGMTTLPELNIWVKNLKTLKTTNQEEIQNAFKNCYKEAEEQHVLTGSITSKDFD